MRVMKGHSSNPTYHIIRDVRKDGKRSTEIVENLGNAEEIMAKYHVTDAEAWVKTHLDELRAKEEKTDHRHLIPFSTDVRIETGVQFRFNAGYLFLQQIYCQLGLPSICRALKKKHSFTYNLDSILSRLIYGRILYPSSKLSCLEQSRKLIEQPDFGLQHIYRALSVLAEDSDFIQEKLYKNSMKLVGRRTGVLFYDCTNFFFEIEEGKGLKQYGVSKEHRPNPIVQMGMFMDASGIPLAMCINKGNQNETLSLRPLEQKILKDFELSRFVVCTDAALSSEANRRFNNIGERSFITAQSIKMLNEELKAWALDPVGWHLEGSASTFDISSLEDTPENRSQIFYKQRLIEGWDKERDISFDQTLIVTFSPGLKLWQEEVRSHQVERAKKILEKPSTIKRKNPNDARSLIASEAVTEDGEIAEKHLYWIDGSKISEEARYDGFGGICTNLDDDPPEIIRINHDRWEIEESFRIMKSEFKARPVYLQRDDRIEAHFLTCFISLLIYRILKKRIGGKYTCQEIIRTLRDMDMTKVGDSGYIPAYTRTELTDVLHDNAGFRTDYELTTPKSMAGICRRSKGL